MELGKSPAEMTRGQVRAGRALLNCKQERLAHLAGVGIATLRRYEGGQEIGPLQQDAIRRALDAAGIVFVPAWTTADGVPLGPGVALKLPDAKGAAARAAPRDRSLPGAAALAGAQAAHREQRRRQVGEPRERPFFPIAAGHEDGIRAMADERFPTPPLPMD